LCKHFTGTDLVGCARAGLECIEGAHRAVITGGASIGCGVALDTCRRSKEPAAPRWDYIFTLRGADEAIAIEVHHATADEVDAMIAKKQWAEHTLASRCPQLRVIAWVWLASPPDGLIDMLPQSPSSRRLVDAKITFPRIKFQLP